MNGGCQGMGSARIRAVAGRQVASNPSHTCHLTFKLNRGVDDERANHVLKTSLPFQPTANQARGQS